MRNFMYLAVQRPAGLPDVDPNAAMKNVITAIFVMAGVVAVVMVIVGGYSYMTAYGDPGKITKAKNTIIGAVAGLIIVLLAFAIFNFVTATIK